MKYFKPKKFTVLIMDENNQKILKVSMLVVQKIDNKPFKNIAGKEVNETLIIKKNSLKIREYKKKLK